MEEKTIEREVIYEGKVFDVEKHVVTLPNGNTSVRELVYHNGAVAIIAFDFYGAPGFCSERVHIYEAIGLTAGDRQLDEDEFLENKTLKLEQALELVANGTIVDAKTIMAIQHWQIRTLK